MGFFRRLGNSFARFMYGRNGVDPLNQALVWVYIAVFLAELVFGRLFRLGLLARILESVNFALLVFILFRMFSKNLPKRRLENEKFTGWQGRIRNLRNGAKARRADKEHKYFTCRNCKTICRVPVGKGKIVITCLKCGAQIDAKT